MAANPLFSSVGTATPPSNQASKTLTGIVPQYQVSLHVEGDESLDSSGKKIFPIVANLPERFNMEFSSNWEPSFARTSAGDLGSALLGGRVNAETINAGLSASGFGNKIRSQTFQVWQDSSPMNFNVEMVFRAVTNSERDIREKHLALLKLAAPSELIGGVLRPPGPNIRNKAIDRSNSRSITLYIGKYLRLEDVVIKSVSSDVVCLFDNNGIPQAMTISIGVESFYACFTAQDIEKMFVVTK